MIDRARGGTPDDATVGGYLARHERAPAFEGSDGHAYSLAVYVDPQPDDDGRYGASLLFVRWSGGADRPAGHVETDDLAWADTADAARAALHDMTLHDAKAHLERAIARQRKLADW